MGRYSRVCLLAGIQLFPVSVFAQFNNNTSSLYSRFGLGDLQSTIFGRTAAMRGASNFYNIQKYQSIRIGDFGLNFGLQATIPIKEKLHLVLGLGAVLENKPEYTAFITDVTKKNLSSGSTSDQDTLNYQEEEKGKVQFPLNYGPDFSYVKEDNMKINFDYVHQSWSKANFFGSTNTVLTDLDKFAPGAAWIPDQFSIRSYVNKVAYRAGIKYEKSYLLPNNQEINDFGISFGVGLPVYRSNSTINLSAEIGRRETKT